MKLVCVTADETKTIALLFNENSKNINDLFSHFHCRR